MQIIEIFKIVQYVAVHSIEFVEPFSNNKQINEKLEIVEEDKIKS